MSELDIAERRLPQDGRIKLKLGRGREMDYRVSVLPTLFGEKTVLRLLDKSNLQLDMTKLGFEQEQLEVFQDAIHQPFGMVLVTGPTGSGKTTTLYSALSELNGVGENISTAEDPVEFNLSGINQVQMHEDIGLNFAAALRSFLRQDPDIIMVGEIRDFETAEIAVKAALTGHMVLSTLHTNDAPSTVNRLLNMGIEPFLVASSVNCDRRPAPGAQGLRGVQGARPGGDPRGARDGRDERGRGRQHHRLQGARVPHLLGHRLQGPDRRLRGDAHEGRTQGVRAEWRIGHGAQAEAIRLGMLTLRRSVLNKLSEGTTTLSEVHRVSSADF